MSVKPFKTFRNGAALFRVTPKKESSRHFCLKVYNLDGGEGGDKQRESIENELKLHLLASALHSNVIQIKGNKEKDFTLDILFFFSHM